MLEYSGLHRHRAAAGGFHEVIVQGQSPVGRAARSKLGRRPLRQSAYRVNCEITNKAPPASCTLRFIFPFSSGKIRKPTSLSKR